MTQYVGGTKVRPLTERQAHAAYRKIVEALRRHLGYSVDELPVRDGFVIQGGATPWPTGPVLVKNYDGWSSNTNDWAVLWEGGDFEWAIYVASGGTTPEGLSFGEGAGLAAVVFAEPIASYALGLYRNT